jgi:predicted small secreted protein
MKKIAKTLSLFALLIAVSLPLAACNTMEGLGEDTQAAGHGLENAARDNKGY